MLFAPALTDRVILPSARGGRYFFNRIGQKQTVVHAPFLAFYRSKSRLPTVVRSPSGSFLRPEPSRYIALNDAHTLPQESMRSFACSAPTQLCSQ
ncbi:hypothetical protein EWS90_23275 [Pseudomonas aeruginosa]|uniref:Uncharacterized protein n=1 Tax=Ectopseudomonas oleovorans TaxID=301 RepID=A0A3R8Y863_ECTOL|nr:hypothetical protein EWS90_23275 [Pseudomonas aeruginosa]RRW37246.1 hypothetical protein EGJ44_08900 [Pseudomonas oleovorans]